MNNLDTAIETLRGFAGASCADDMVACIQEVNPEADLNQVIHIINIIIDNGITSLLEESA